MEQVNEVERIEKMAAQLREIVAKAESGVAALTPAQQKTQQALIDLHKQECAQLDELAAQARATAGAQT